MTSHLRSSSLPRHTTRSAAMADTAATSEESPAQRQARIRREKREKKILEGGSARLDKITSMSGRPVEPGMCSPDPSCAWPDKFQQLPRRPRIQRPAPQLCQLPRTRMRSTFPPCLTLPAAPVLLPHLCVAFQQMGPRKPTFVRFSVALRPAQTSTLLVPAQTSSAQSQAMQTQARTP